MKKSQEREEAEAQKHSGVKVMITGRGRNLCVWAEGAKKMLLCLPSAVRILLDGEVLSLSGHELVCVTYAGGAVEVTGLIDEIRFEHVKRAL